MDDPGMGSFIGGQSSGHRIGLGLSYNGCYQPRILARPGQWPAEQNPGRSAAPDQLQPPWRANLGVNIVARGASPRSKVGERQNSAVSPLQTGRETADRMLAHVRVLSSRSAKAA